MAEMVARGTRFHVQRMGQGAATVVFIHGLVMDNLSSFYYTLAPAVADFANVVLFDLRGHGLSERPRSGYSVPEQLADLNALLDALHVESSVWVVGHSYGGLLALAFAADAPSRVAGLALLDPLVPHPGWQRHMAQTLELKGEERHVRIRQSFASWLGRHSRRKTTRLARAAEDLVTGTTLIEDVRSSPALSPRELRGISCPTLLLLGEHSDVRAEAERLAGVLPSCAVQVMAGCSHSVLWEQTAEVRRELTDWLRVSVEE